MKKITLLLAFGLFTLIGTAQTFQWAKQIAGTAANPFSVTIKDLRPISNGHVFVCGSFTGTVDFDPSSNTNFKTAQGTDGFVGQYDSGGNLLWLYTTNQSGDEEAKGLCLNTNYIPARLISVFQQGTNSFLLRSFNISDGTIFSTSSTYSATGTINITSLNPFAQLDTYMVGGSYSGSITVEGQTRTSAGQQDGFVAKFQSNGSSAASAFEFGWLKSYGGNGNDQVNSVVFYGLMSCAGYFENTADFDGDPSTSSTIRTSAGGKDCFKLDLDFSNGNTQSTISFGSTGDDSVSAICDTFPGVISGYFSNTLPVDPTDIDNNLVSSGGKDGFVVRYNSTIHLWSQKIGGTNDDEIVRLTKNVFDSNIYYAAKLGAPSGSATSIGSYDQATGAVSAFGGIFFPSNQTTLNAPLCIAQDFNTSAGVFTSGIFNATTDFNPQTGTASITPVSGGNNGFIQKMAACNTSAGSPTISGNNSVCLGQSITLSVGSSAGLNNNNEWKWYTDSCGGTLVGTGLTITVSPSIQTTYYVRGEGGCVPNGNCSAGKTISIITTLPSDAVTISGNTLTATQTSATYQWIDCNNGNSDIVGATSRTYTPTVSGNYAVRVTNSSGCTVTSNCSLLTICNPATNPQITGSANAICVGQSRTLTATGNLNQSLEWKWYTGNNCGQTLIGTGPSITVSPTVTTAYYCRGEGGCNQDGLCRTVNVQVNAAPSNAVSQTGNTLTAQESGATYQWVDCNNGNQNIAGATNQAFTPTVSGNYAVKVTSTSGCTVTSSCTQVTICNPASTPTISGSNSICVGSNITLSLGSGNLNSSTDWKWYSSSCGGTLVGTGTSITVSPTVTTDYYVRGEGGCSVNGNCSVAKTVTVNALPNNAVTLSGTTLTATQASATYQWVDCNNGNQNIAGATNQAFTPSISGNYAVKVTSTSGCTVTSACTQVTICTSASTPTISGGSSICVGSNITLSVGSGNLNSSTDWKWYSGSCGGTLVGTGTSITVSPTVITDYYVRGEGGCINNGSCSVVKTVTVNALPNNAVTLSGNTLTASQASATYQWVDCNNGNQNITGAISQTFTPTISGSYAVKVTSTNGCTITSVCTAVNVLGMDQFTKHGLKLYPNPAKTVIEIGGDVQIYKLSIVDMLGQKVLESHDNKTQCNVEKLASGRYFIQLETNLGNMTASFIKE